MTDIPIERSKRMHGVVFLAFRAFGASALLAQVFIAGANAHESTTGRTYSSCDAVVSYGVQFTSVSAPSPNDVWVAAPGSEPVAAAVGHWNGRTWHFWCDESMQLQDISAVSSSDVWAVDGKLVRRWNGRKWLSISNPSLKASIPLSVSAVSDADVWTAGPTGIEQWNGRSWLDVRNKEGGGAFGGISATSPKNAWTVWQSYSSHPRSAVERWNGKRWFRYSAASGPLHSLKTVQAVAAVSSTDAWAVGAGIAHWDGTRWRVDSPPKFGGHTVNFESVSAASAGDVWAIGYAGSGTVVERWNGRKWMAAPGANGLAGSYGQPAVAATRAGSGAFAVGLNAIEWWTGSRWRSILSAVPGVYGGYFNSVAAVAGQFWMAGLYHRSANGKSTYGLIERWHDGSGIVTPIPSPNNHADLFGIAGTSARDVWAVGNRLRASDAQYHSALIIHWNGTSWRSVAPAVGAGPQVTLQAVAAISPVDAWAVGGGNPYSSPPVFEHWNGKAWTVVPGAGSLAAGSISGLSAVSHNDVWAVGAEESGAAQLPSPVIEHWNGTAWSVVPAHDTQNVDGGGLSAVTAVNAHDVWAVGGNQEGTDGINLVEHWNGGAWSIPAGPNTGGYSLVSVAAQSRRDIWAIGQEYAPYEPYIQHWNGSAWTDISSPFIGGQNILTSVAAASKSNAWAVGGEAFANTRQPVPIEHWNGRTWSVVVGPLPSW